MKIDTTNMLQEDATPPVFGNERCSTDCQCKFRKWIGGGNAGPLRKYCQRDKDFCPVLLEGEVK